MWEKDNWTKLKRYINQSLIFEIMFSELWICPPMIIQTICIFHAAFIDIIAIPFPWEGSKYFFENTSWFVDSVKFIAQNDQRSEKFLS